MGIKRAHSGGGASSGPFEDPARKRMRTNRPHKPRPQAVDLDSMSAIKKRARAIERLLSRDNLKLPANKQKDLERELAAHTQRIEHARTKKDRSKMIQKYHMVRFFERKKAMRLAKQLEKRVAQATDPEELSQLKADLHVAQVDIDYAVYFPFMEAYISLYAGATSGQKDETNTAAQYLRAPRPSIWTVVEKTREAGQAALEKLQNRQPQTTASSEVARQNKRPQTVPKSEVAQQPAKNDAPARRFPDKKARKMTPRQERRALARAALGGSEGQAGKVNNADDESDGGGFFEED